MAETIAHFAPQVKALGSHLMDLLDPAERARTAAAAATYVDRGVPADLAARVVALDTLYAALDIVEVAGSAQRPVETVAAVYFELSTRLSLPWLREKIAALPGDAHWQALAKGAMQDDLASLQRTISAEALGDAHDVTSSRKLVSDWQGRNKRSIDRVAQLVGELRSAPMVDAAMLSVTLRELRNLA
jgi:glutamate dehydrogenase